MQADDLPPLTCMPCVPLCCTSHTPQLAMRPPARRVPSPCTSNLHSPSPSPSPLAPRPRPSPSPTLATRRLPLAARHPRHPRRPRRPRPRPPPSALALALALTLATTPSPSLSGAAASGEDCGKGSAQREGGQNQGPMKKDSPRVWHTCKRECCGKRFACKPGTASTKHSVGGCYGLCVGFKKGSICQGC